MQSDPNRLGSSTLENYSVFSLGKDRAAPFTLLKAVLWTAFIKEGALALVTEGENLEDCGGVVNYGIEAHPADAGIRCNLIQTGWDLPLWKIILYFPSSRIELHLSRYLRPSFGRLFKKEGALASVTEGTNLVDCGGVNYTGDTHPADAGIRCNLIQTGWDRPLWKIIRYFLSANTELHLSRYLRPSFGRLFKKEGALASVTEGKNLVDWAGAVKYSIDAHPVDAGIRCNLIQTG